MQICPTFYLFIFTPAQRHGVNSTNVLNFPKNLFKLLNGTIIWKYIAYTKCSITVKFLRNVFFCQDIV